MQAVLNFFSHFFILFCFLLGTTFSCLFSLHFFAFYLFSFRIAARHKIGAKSISNLQRPFLPFLLTPKIVTYKIKVHFTFCCMHKDWEALELCRDENQIAVHDHKHIPK